MPTLHSHTHCQVAQADPQAKTWQRVRLSNRTRTVQARHERPLKERRAATNSTYPKGGVSCSKDRFVVTGTFVLLINICGESPALRVAAKR